MILDCEDFKWINKAFWNYSQLGTLNRPASRRRRPDLHQNEAHALQVLDVLLQEVAGNLQQPGFILQSAGKHLCGIGAEAAIPARRCRVIGAVPFLMGIINDTKVRVKSHGGEKLTSWTHDPHRPLAEAELWLPPGSAYGRRGQREEGWRSSGQVSMTASESPGLFPVEFRCYYNKISSEKKTVNPQKSGSNLTLKTLQLKTF